MTNATIQKINRTSGASRKIARNIFIALTAINGLVALALGIMTLVNMQGVFESFGVPYTRALDSLGLTASGLFILLAVLSLVSIIWLVQGKLEGILMPASYATFLFALGIMVLVRLGQTDVLYVDSIRGFLTMVASIFAYREMKQ